MDKRIPFEWLNRCWRELHSDQQMLPQLQWINGLRVFAEPKGGRKYCIGGDPAQGNPNSNPSAFVVVDALTGEEVCHLNQKLTPRRMGELIDRIGTVYNNASVLLERNNHGHAVLLWMEDNSKLRLLDGPDGQPGWNESHKSKTILFDSVTERIRDGEAIVHSFELFSQLGSVDGETLDQPEGENSEHGDLAMAYVLALKATALDRYGKIKPEDFANFRVKMNHGLPYGMSEYHQRPQYTDKVNRRGEGSHNPFGVN